VSSGLPETQWQTEVENIFNTLLSFLQSIITAHVSPPILSITPNSTLRDYFVQVTNDPALEVCRNVMIRSTDYSSFSVMGLAIIGFSTIILMLLALLMPLLARFYYSHSGRSDAFRPDEEWEANHPMRLLILALEGHGIPRISLSEQVATFVPPWQVRSKVDNARG
jgi:hypothetical protein